ncbi:trypsin-like serine peptidase [Sorangium sp. So ce1097]|uniref:trypsin-like serine peptidase n=1 Tax=Sorangium sp. So ce1097 TaxID=3133330 RepID=UPI003F617674
MAVLGGVDGEDDRKECGARAQCDAVALLVHRDAVESVSASRVALQTETYQRRHSLCEGTRFASQPVIARGACTGFLVERDTLATAGHCVIGKALEDLRVVFGYRMTADGAALAELSPQQVYRVVREKHPPKDDDETDEDWALIELDRDVLSVAPLPLERSEPVRQGEPVFMIGHPLGLPLKYDDGAVVRDASPAFHFRASLDAFGGSSGSPVLNGSGKVVGLLSSGNGPDHVRQAGGAGCREVYACRGCQGKKVTRSSAFASKVKDGSGVSPEAAVGRQ